MQGLQEVMARDIDDIIRAVKEHPNINGIQALYLIKQIETAPSNKDLQDLRLKHQFKADLHDDSKCICGNDWNVPKHN